MKKIIIVNTIGAAAGFGGAALLDYFGLPWWLMIGVLILGISAFQYVASQMERRETEQQAERVVVKPATEREITEEEGQAALRRFEDAKRRAEQARRRV